MTAATTDQDPYDYALERADARRAAWWRYAQPGQWLDGWETYEGGAA